MAAIGVMTFLHNGNYGSTLQAWALQRTIIGMGHDCEHIDYQPGIWEKSKNLLLSGNSPRLILDGMRKRKVRAEESGARIKSEAIPRFYREEMRLSPVCSSWEDLVKQAEKYDILICGSDQIWNPVWLNSAYFLPFAGKEQKKIAYAASLGVSVMPSRRKAALIKKWTADFQAISIRENQGAELMGRITGRTPRVMPDPVCLPEREDWEKLAAPAPVSAEEPYLLCYFIGENPDYWDKVRRLSKERELKPLIVPVTAESYRQGFDLLDGADPREFLGAVRDSDMVCTDSFHCCAFSEIFERECEVCRRDRDDDPNSKNSRIDSFRHEVNTKGLEGMRKEGKDWLRGAIGNK